MFSGSLTWSLGRFDDGLTVVFARISRNFCSFFSISSFFVKSSKAGVPETSLNFPGLSQPLVTWSSFSRCFIRQVYSNKDFPKVLPSSL